MDNDLAIQQVSKELDIITDEKDHMLMKQMLIKRINELLTTDFQKLVSILYRIDVSEAKLKLLLKENPGIDAGLIIAELMIERQAQKIKSRQEHSRDPTNSDEEAW